MNIENAEKIAKSVLYEGYMLYPYRPSATKNRQHWSFGTLYPECYHEVLARRERASLQMECLLTASADAKIELGVRFLHLRDRQIFTCDPEMGYRAVASLAIDGRLHESWQEGIERSVDAATDFAQRLSSPRRFAFSFPASEASEELCDSGVPVGKVERVQHAIAGVVEVSASLIAGTLHLLTVRVVNATAIPAEQPERTQALLLSFLSAHVIARAHGGEFVSLLDPPEDLAQQAQQCRNIGVYPVLIGEPGERSLMLASPIALYDYPRIAPESAGDFFDSTEIDELLTLRIVTLTDDEKRAMGSADEHVRRVLERAEKTGREQMMRTHGTLREVKPAKDKAA